MAVTAEARPDEKPTPGLKRRLLGRRRRRFAADEGGAAAIEFAMLALPFFFVIFAIIETSIVFLGEMTLDRAVDAVGRQVRTGEIANAELTKEQFHDRICDEVDFLMGCRKDKTKLKIDLSTYATYGEIRTRPPLKADGNYDYTGFGFNPGGAEKIVALRVFYEWPIVTDIMRKSLGNANGDFVMTAMTAFKTESYEE